MPSSATTETSRTPHPASEIGRTVTSATIDITAMMVKGPMSIPRLRAMQYAAKPEQAEERMANSSAI